MRPQVSNGLKMNKQVNGTEGDPESAPIEESF